MFRLETALLPIALLFVSSMGLGCDDTTPIAISIPQPDPDPVPDPDPDSDPDLEIGSKRIKFVNNGEHAVQLVLANDDDASTGDDDIDDVGTQSAYTIQPASPLTVTFTCQMLQAVKIVEAELQVDINGGPTTSSETLRNSVDFDCEDTIIFTFDHSALLSDFNVEATVDRN